MGGRTELSRRGRHGLVLWALGSAVVLLVALAPLPATLRGDRATATTIGLFGSAAIGMLSALAVLAWWFHRRAAGAPQAAYRAFFALGVLGWSAGQTLTAVDAFNGELRYPAQGDMVSMIATPLGLIGLLAVPRTSTSSWPGLRLGLDSVALGISAVFAGRMLVFAHEETGQATDGFGTVFFLLANFSVLAMMALVGIRDLRSRIGPAVLGVACHTVADSVLLQVMTQGSREYTWWMTALWCVAWPLVAIGIVRYQPRRPADAGSPEQDRREALVARIATVGSYACIVAVLFLAPDPLPDHDAVILLVVVLAVLGVRELVGALLRVQLTTRLRVQAHRDPLTKLANRRALTSRIDRLDDTRPWVVLTLDLDGFKQVNDLLGHQAGDELLIAVADALRRTCPPDCLPARIGGDEFAILGPGDLADGALLGELLRFAVRTALEEHAPGLNTSASVGVGRLVRMTGARETTGGADRADRLAALVESAAALRAAKAGGRDRVEVYAGEVASDRERRLLLEHRLRHADRVRAFVTHGQPVVDLATGALSGFEALARWTDEVLGDVSPEEFVPVTEQTGLIVSIGEHIVDSTLAGAAGAGVFDAGLTVAINASPVQLRVPGFPDMIGRLLEQHEVPARQIVIEVTEAILVADDDPALRALEQLAALGVGIAIDDFGTGYSAVGYLRRLPVHVLKIDRSLTRDLLVDPRTSAIVRGVVAAAHEIGLEVVTEGIETEEVAEACRAIGADEGQGWLYGRAVPWQDAADLVADQIRFEQFAGAGARFAGAPSAGAGAGAGSGTGPRNGGLPPVQRTQGEAPAEEPAAG